MQNKYEIGVYYFPNFHIDPRNEEVHGPGWNEWELMKRAVPRFPGHRQPLVPAWGYEDESDPTVMAKKIDAAADHGVTNFIFDWYWYENKPYLHKALENGFMGAQNNQRIGFSLMWANHDWLHMHPASYYDAKFGTSPMLFHGAVNEAEFNDLTDYVIDKYFKHPSYWKINGCPYFSIYSLADLLKSFGGVAGAAKALETFRAKTKKAGFPDLHLNSIAFALPNLPQEYAVKDYADTIKSLNFDSTGSYTWIHDIPRPDFPTTDYSSIKSQVIELWKNKLKGSGVSYYPHVTMGWDSSPRTVQSDTFINMGGGPFTPILSNNTPEAFSEYLQIAKDFMDQEIDFKFLTINAWNEWTEGSYLEPDTEYGMGYLEAIRDVFVG
ncbi:MAG: glycoside hydrolase family 99-like domain-containing protein [Armatimonadota bacterium]|nr:glycoside hydrolase family 99-like domain-containing protein [bacterium]